MILSARFIIGPAGLIRYSQELSGEMIPIGETGKLQLDALSDMHEAIKEAVTQVNTRLSADGIADKLAEREPTKYDDFGNVIATGKGWTTHSSELLQHDSLAEKGHEATLGADSSNDID